MTTTLLLFTPGYVAAENVGGLVEIVILIVIFLGVVLMSTFQVPYFYVGVLLILVGVFFAKRTGQLRAQKRAADADTTLEIPSKAKIRFAGSTAAFCVFFGGVLSILSCPGLAYFTGQSLNIVELKNGYTHEQENLIRDYVASGDVEHRKTDRFVALLWRGADPRWGDVLAVMDKVDEAASNP